MWQNKEKARQEHESAEKDRELNDVESEGAAGELVREVIQLYSCHDFSASFHTLGHHLLYVNTASLKKGSHVWAVGGFLLKQASRSLLGILTAHFNVKILFF